MLLHRAQSLKSFVGNLGPAAWWQLGVGVTVATGVSQWADQSGNGRHLVQATGAAQPALQADKSILFDGSAQYLQAAAFSVAQPFTFYMRYKQVSWTINKTHIDFGSSAALIYTPTTTPNIIFYAGTSQLGNSLATGTYGALVVVGNGASSLAQLNQGAPVTGNAGAGAVSTISMGASNGGGAGTFSNIQVKEAVLYSGAHDANTRSKVISYLSSL